MLREELRNNCFYTNEALNSCYVYPPKFPSACEGRPSESLRRGI